MRRILQATLLTSAVAALGLSGAAVPAAAQMDQMDQSDQGFASISFDSFQDQLAPYGWWLYSDRWGVVWQPFDASPDFRPYYSAGHWLYTDDYGWYWQSDYPWGDIPFHYGRWINDPDDGWLWMPGYVWSPGWVTWRSNGQYIGWMPMPPDDAFLSGRGDIGFGMSFRFGIGDIGGLYGYSRWYGPAYDENRFAQNWVFVGAGQIVAPDYRVVAIRDPGRVINIIHQTRNITNYTVVNNYVVNRSVDVHMVERAAGRPIPVVHAATVIRHPNLVATVAVGQRVQVRMRTVAPRGMGIANSAPPPPPHVVEKLSANVTPHNGHAPVHLYTKSAVQAPEAQSRFKGPVVHGPGAPGPGGAMEPGAERPHETPPGAGPNGAMGRGPAAGRPHEGQPGAATGEMGSGAEHPRPQPGMTGPSPEGAHEAQPGGGPSGAPSPETEKRHETEPGMTGPNTERPREAQPGAGPNGPSVPETERRHETQPGMAPGEAPPGSERSRPEQGMNGPSAERPHSVAPSGTMAPQGTHPESSPPRAHPPQGQNEQNPPKQNPPKKKEPNPDESPPH